MKVTQLGTIVENVHTRKQLYVTNSCLTPPPADVISSLSPTQKKTLVSFFTYMNKTSKNRVVGTLRYTHLEEELKFHLRGTLCNFS